MMKLVQEAGDRLLAMVVPRVAAKATHCECKCTRCNAYKRYVYDTQDGPWYANGECKETACDRDPYVCMC